MAVRRVKVLKRKSGQGKLLERLLDETPRPNPERERFFAGLISKMENGRLSEAEFIEKLGAMKREVEGPREGYRRYMFLGMGGSRKESSIGRIGGRIALAQRRKAEPERTRPAEEPRVIVNKEKKLKQFDGGTNLRDRRVVSNIRKWKKEREAVNKRK